MLKIIKSIAKKKRRLFICVMFLLAVIAFSLFRLRDVNLLGEKKVYPDCDDFLKEICDGEIYEQGFIMPMDEPENLIISVATFQRVNNATMVFALLDNNKTEIKKWEVSETDFEDNSLYMLDVYDIRGLLIRGKNYYLKFYSLGSFEGNAISLKSSTYNADFNELYLNGTTPIGKRIYISFSKELNIYRFIVCLSVSLIVCGIILFSFLESERIKPDIKVFISLMFVGLLMMLVLPPMTTPDEPSHFATAYSYSNKLMGINPSADKSGFVLGRNEDNTILTPGELKWYYSSLFVNTSQADDSIVSLYNINKPLVIFPLPYILPALGISIARLLNFSNTYLFYSGAFMNLLLYAVIISLSYKYNRCLRNTIVVVSFLPMISSTLASYSYDTYNNAILFAYVAFLISSIFEKTSIQFKEIIIIIAMEILVIPVKALYIPICLLVFLIPNHKFKSISKAIGYKFFLFGIAIASLPLGLLYRVNPSNPGNSNVENAWNIGDGIILVLDTIFKDADFFIETMLGKSLGWLNIEIPIWLVLIFFVILLIGILADNIEIQKYNNLGNRITSVSIVLVGAFLLLCGFYIMYPAESAILKHVFGVQGRYFLPYLLLIPLCFKSNINIQDFSIEKIIECELIVSIITVFEIILSSSMLYI